MTSRNEIPNTNQPCYQWPLLLRTDNSSLILGFPTIHPQFSQRCRQFPCLSTAGVACSLAGGEPPTSLSADICLQIPPRFHLSSLRNSIVIPSPPSERHSHNASTPDRRAVGPTERRHDGFRRELPLPLGYWDPSHDWPRRGSHGLPHFQKGQHCFTSEHAAFARRRQRCRLDLYGRQAHQLGLSELGHAEKSCDCRGCAHGAIAEAVGRYRLG